MEKYVFSILVSNRFGVLTRVSSMFTRRGFNIDTLTVGETESPEFSRITISMRGDEYSKTQIIKHISIPTSAITRESLKKRYPFNALFSVFSFPAAQAPFAKRLFP